MRAQNMLVIGNGFDMFLGLNSSYKSFLGLSSKKGTYYGLNSRLSSLKIAYNKWNNSSTIIENDDFLLMNKLFNIPQKIYSTVQKHINKKDTINVLGNEQNFWEDTKHYNKKSIFKFTNSSHVNFWSAYLILRKYNKDVDWYSIESEMYNFLTNRNTDFYEIANFLYYMLTGHQHNFKQINPFMWRLLPAHSNGAVLGKDKFTKRNNKYFYDNSSFTIDQLKNSMINVGNNHSWLRAIDVYSLVFLMLNVRSHYFKNIKLFKWGEPKKFDDLCCHLYDFLKGELTDFECDLDGYLLHTCIKGYKDKYKISYNIIGQRLLNGMSSRKPFSLLDFNYTTPFIEDYDFPDVRSIKNKLLVLRRNIHGRLIDSNPMNYDTSKAPIIGISSNGIDINSPIYKFTKNYRIMRLSCNKYGDVFLHKNSIKEIKFFGQSFDAADYDYFFDIFDQFHIDKSHVKLVFFYAPHGGESDDEGAINQINSVNSLFTHYCLDRLGLSEKNAKELLHTLSFEGRVIVININNQINKYPLLKRYVDIINITSITENLKNTFDIFKNENMSTSKQFILLMSTDFNISDLRNDIKYMLNSCNFKLKMEEVKIYNKLNDLSKRFMTDCQTYSKLLGDVKFDKCIHQIQLIIRDVYNIKDDIAKFNILKK